MTLPAFPRRAWLAACLAAVLFAATLLLALWLVPGWQPLAHPLAVLGYLPGVTGWALAGGSFVLPGLLAGLALYWRPQPDSRLGRVAGQLGAMAVAGFVLMGLLPLPLSPADGAGRGHAVAWMLWLAAAGAAMVVDGLARVQASRPVAGVAGMACGALLWGLCLTPWLPLPGPLAQLLAWGIWLGWGIAVARQAAPLR